MKQLLSALILGCGLAAAQANAACDYPAAPGQFPDGTQATKEEMLAGKKVFTAYDGQMTAYLECLKSEFQASVAALPPDAPKKQKEDLESQLGQKQNAALQEAEAVKNRLNKEIAAYVKLHPPAPKPN
jgi:hypothetical protein